MSTQTPPRIRWVIPLVVLAFLVSWADGGALPWVVALLGGAILLVLVESAGRGEDDEREEQGAWRGLTTEVVRRWVRNKVGPGASVPRAADETSAGRKIGEARTSFHSVAAELFDGFPPAQRRALLLDVLTKARSGEDEFEVGPASVTAVTVREGAVAYVRARVNGNEEKTVGAVAVGRRFQSIVLEKTREDRETSFGAFGGAVLRARASEANRAGSTFNADADSLPPCPDDDLEEEVELLKRILGSEAGTLLPAVVSCAIEMPGHKGVLAVGERDWNVRSLLAGEPGEMLGIVEASRTEGGRDSKFSALVAEPDVEMVAATSKGRIVRALGAWLIEKELTAPEPSGGDGEPDEGAASAESGEGADPDESGSSEESGEK